MAKFSFPIGNTINVGRIPWNKGLGLGGEAEKRRAETRRRHYLENREYLLAKHKEYLAKKRENPIYNEQRKKKQCEYARNYILRRKYRLTPFEYDHMLAEQDNRCALCHRQFSDIPRSGFYPVLDHCHRTGNLRRFLHVVCNAGLGMFEDNPDLLRLAIKYIDAHTEDK